MDDQQEAGSGRDMLIIGAHDGNLRLACEACGAHAIRPSFYLFGAARCHVCGVIEEIHGARTRITDSPPDPGLIACDQALMQNEPRPSG